MSTKPDTTTTKWAAVAVLGLSVTSLLGLMAAMIYGIVSYFTSRRREGFYVIDNEGTRTYKAELTGSGLYQMTTGIVQMTKPKDNSSVKLEFECSLPEPQATFVYHRPAEEVCQCKDNCHWDSKCECGGCSTFKASVTTRSGQEVPVGNLIRHGDGVSRVTFFSEKSLDIVSAKVTLVTKNEEVPVIDGMFY